jgi:hypothetical protein
MTKDYWVCYHCGLELDRSNQWEMIQVDSHLDKHNNKEAN